MVILFIWKRALLFSFFIISFFCNAQKIIRFSDGKQIDSVFVVNSTQKILIHKKNVVNYNYTSNDRILYQNKIYDFTLENDSLILFDKTKEIEPVNIVNVNN
ncbi:hypothetical protein, partial [Chryseobacterium sp. HMWF001]